MAVRKHKRQRKDDMFYEAMPYAPTRPYQDWTAQTPEDDEAPDHDFAAIEDDGRAVAIRTLIFVALATAALCLILLWSIQMAQDMLPATASAPLQG